MITEDKYNLRYTCTHIETDGQTGGQTEGELEGEVEGDSDGLSRKGGRGTFSVGCLPKPLMSPKGNILFPGECKYL